MKDMKAPPKKIALVKAWMLDWVGESRSQTVPIMMARPRYMAIRMPYATISRWDLMKERWTRGKRVERADTRVLEEVVGEDWRELDGILAATRRFADSVAAAGDVAQEVWR
jgi:hypothetical protein